MSMDRCTCCDAIVDTDDCDDCRYLPFGLRDDRLVCENCLPEYSVCDRCKFVCQPVEHEETEISEAWGQREVSRVRYMLSDCCSETVLTAEEFA